MTLAAFLATGRQRIGYSNVTLAIFRAGVHVTDAKAVVAIVTMTSRGKIRVCAGGVTSQRRLIPSIACHFIFSTHCSTI